MSERALKRLFDLVFSALGLFLLGPLLVLLVVAVRLDSRGPSVVAHQRIGRRGHTFRLFRFRTRTWNNGLGSDYTDLGRVLEETGLADLPQLWNILRGDLSVFGPPAPRSIQQGAPWRNRRRDLASAARGDHGAAFADGRGGPAASHPGRTVQTRRPRPPVPQGLTRTQANLPCGATNAE